MTPSLLIVNLVYGCPQKQGYGWNNMAADDLSSIQLYYLQQLRQKMPNKIISYTFPAANYRKSDTVRTINFPFRDVVICQFRNVSILPYRNALLKKV